MGLIDANSLVDGISKILTGGMGGDAQTHLFKKDEPPFDVNRYFAENTLDDWTKLKDDDLLTISTKNENGYVAKFVRLGDLKKFFKN